jgi:hypothetical protein
VARNIDDALRDGTASELLKYALSTIRPSSTLRVAVIYEAGSFCGIEAGVHSEWPHLRWLSRSEKEQEAAKHLERFKLLCEVHKVRSFTLELCANVWDPVGEYAVRVLREAAIEARKADEVFRQYFPVLWVSYDPRWDRTI